MFMTIGLWILFDLFSKECFLFFLEYNLFNNIISSEIEDK